MKNQILKSFLTIKKRVHILRDRISIEENIEINAKELEIISNRFNVSNIEALLLAGSFIELVDGRGCFRLDNLAQRLEVEILDLLFYQEQFKKLVEKKYLIEVSRENCRNSRNFEQGIEILNIEYGITDSFGNEVLN